MVNLLGRDIGLLSETQRADLRNAHIGFIFQFYHLLGEFTALENVMLPGLIQKKGGGSSELKKKALVLLEKVGLEERSTHFPGELSGGEQQRVAIARSLMNDPDLVFCDEPTGNLDPETGEKIVALLGRLFRQERKTVVIATHDARIARMADKVWNLVKGAWA